MAGVASMRFTISEEPEFLFAIADEHVFRPLIMVEHHLMVLAANPRHLVSAERGMGRIQGEFNIFFRRAGDFA